MGLSQTLVEPMAFDTVRIQSGLPDMDAIPLQAGIKAGLTTRLATNLTPEGMEKIGYGFFTDLTESHTLILTYIG